MINISWIHTFWFICYFDSLSHYVAENLTGSEQNTVMAISNFPPIYIQVQSKVSISLSTYVLSGLL